jgi:hypothetical protein
MEAMVDSCVAVSIGTVVKARDSSPPNIALHSSGTVTSLLLTQHPRSKLYEQSRQNGSFSRFKGSDIDRAWLW